MSRHTSGRNAALTLLVAAVTAGLAFSAYSDRSRRIPSHPPDSAPGRTSRQNRFGDYVVTGKTVTINRPRAELFAFWRDFNNLPRFMENIVSVEPTGRDRMIWTIKAPLGQQVEVETEIVSEHENELISWRSVLGSHIDTEGRVAFRDAPGGRGTEVEAIVAYDPPGGELGRWIAKIFQREPAIQGRRELKRFKMLMETGEIATASHYIPKI